MEDFCRDKDKDKEENKNKIPLTDKDFVFAELLNILCTELRRLNLK